MRTWDAFFADVLPDVLGCPEPTAERHILRAARRFCAETGAWRVDLDPTTTRADTTVYDLELPSGAEAVKILGGTLNGQDVDVEGADATSPGRRASGGAGRTRVMSRDGFSVALILSDVSFLAAFWSLAPSLIRRRAPGVVTPARGAMHSHSHMS